MQESASFKIENVTGMVFTRELYVRGIKTQEDLDNYFGIPFFSFERVTSGDLDLHRLLILCNELSVPFSSVCEKFNEKERALGKALMAALEYTVISTNNPPRNSLSQYAAVLEAVEFQLKTAEGLISK